MKENWEYKRLGEVGNVVGGSTPKTSVPEFWGGDNFWVTPAELTGNRYVDSTERLITDDAVVKTNLTLLPVGTVLLTSRAPIGKVCITKVPMFCNQGFKNIICSNQLYNEFLYWWLFGKTDYLNSLGVGATFKEISKRIVEQIIIPVPPLDEQKKIVAELDLLSDVIDKQKAELRELDNLAQSTFYDMFGDPIENPKGWETRPLNEVAPQRPYEGTVPDVNGKYWLLNLDKVVSQSGDVLEKEMVDLNEIGNSVVAFDSTNVLYSKLRPYLNKVVIPNDFGYATSELVPLKPNRECLDRVFLTFLLRSKSFVNLISVRVAGAKMPRVSMDFLRNFEVILPPLDLQQSFADKIASIEKQKAVLSQSIVETQKLLDYTMDKYFG